MNDNPDRARRLARLDAIQGDDDGDIKLRSDVRAAQKAARDKQRAEKYAYDLAHPPAEREAEAAEDAKEQIARLTAMGVSDDLMGAVSNDFHTLMTRNLPREPQTAPTEAMRRRVVQPWHTAVEMERTPGSALGHEAVRVEHVEQAMRDASLVEDAEMEIEERRAERQRRHP